ncbi:hypothetical protein CMUS01_02335 [Colletotrichum musicola]|uniref:Uncharacterized protein n=1 Tax=Colletotrichum musicola TaxID=2175873 RepID=A0A8H6U757_9PEZI|nr:hypothetical protein CMUS01_02335 [Colletotrichum musicola]
MHDTGAVDEILLATDPDQPEKVTQCLRRNHIAALNNYGDNNSDNDDSLPAKSSRKEHSLSHRLRANGTHDAFTGRIAGLRAIYRRALVASSMAWRIKRRVVVA